MFLLVVAWFSHTGQRWVWFLDGANLLFHEAGHPIFGLVWSALTVYGGMADARAQALPLVGSGDHDWTTLFTDWGVLQSQIFSAGRTPGRDEVGTVAQPGHATLERLLIRLFGHCEC